MTTNLPTLFDLSKCEKRKTPIQESFEEANLVLLSVFHAAVHRAFERVHNEIFTLIKPSAMDRNLPAVAMSSFIREIIIQRFPEYCAKATKSRFKLVTPNGEWAFIKKLDHKKRPQNIETYSNELILNQVTQDLKDKAGNVFLGYTSKGDNSKVTGVYAVCLEGKKQLWLTDITTLISHKKSVLARFQTNKKKTTLKPGTVKLKKRKDNQQ
jgi:hypothetical protein